MAAPIRKAKQEDANAITENLRSLGGFGHIDADPAGFLSNTRCCRKTSAVVRRLQHETPGQNVTDHSSQPPERVPPSSWSGSQRAHISNAEWNSTASVRSRRPDETASQACPG